MSSVKQYLNNWFRWREGRQRSGYEKMLLLANPILLPFDCYLLRFRPDRSPHSVTRVIEGTRYVLSVGWVRGAT